MTDITAGAAPELEPTPGAAPEVAPAETAPPQTPPARKPHPWTDVSAHPWRRYFARSVDNILFGLSSLFIVTIIGMIVAPDLTQQWIDLLGDNIVGALISAPLLILMTAPAVIVSIALTGGTPGKWLFGVRVTRADGRRLGLVASALREIKVITFGFGLGVPVLCLIAMWNAKETLENQAVTDWDEQGDNRVTHRPMGVWQVTLMVVGGAIWGAMRAWDVIERFSTIAG